jgi:hypothetical protein
VLVICLPEVLQDNANHMVSDWGSSGRSFKSCQPDYRSEDLVARAVLQRWPLWMLTGVMKSYVVMASTIRRHRPVAIGQCA